MLWLCLHFPLLPLEIFTRARAGAHGEAWLVAEAQRVGLCNQAAATAGIEQGMCLATAYAIVGTSLHVVDRDRAREQAVLGQLAQWAYRFTPAVSLKAPDALLLEVGASLRLFRGLQAIVSAIEEYLAAQGFSHRCGLAHTPAAAWLIAQGCPGALPPWFDAHRQRCRRAVLTRALGTLPLSLLDCPAPLLDRLHKPGFRTLGDLLSLPRAALARRFGLDFTRYLERILGEAPDPRAPIQPECRFRRELRLPEPVHSRETLLFPIQRLLHELTAFLQSRQLDCAAFTWHLQQQDADTVELTIRLSRPQHHRQIFMALTRTRLDTIRLQAPVTGLLLDCPRFSQTEQRSGMLFDGEQETGQATLDALLDKLRARLQPQQIYALACRDAHVPELAWSRLAPEHDRPACAVQPAPDRPGWLLSHPRRIEGPGNTLHWHGRLRLIMGPERIDTLWWQRPVRRDYYIARHEQGGLYWVFLDRQRKQWYLHGIFA